MDKFAVALVLEEIAVLLELHGANRFKAQAYRRAAKSIERSDADVRTLVAGGGIDALPGFGPATVAVVRDLVERGESRLHRDLHARTPEGMYELLGVPGLGPGRIAKLHEHLGIDSLAALARALAAGEVAAVPGFGEKTQARLVAGIGFVQSSSAQRRRPQALEAAGRLCSFLAGLDGVVRAEYAGELRRGCEVVSALPLLAAAPAQLHPLILDAFRALPGAGSVRGGGDGAGRTGSPHRTGPGAGAAGGATAGTTAEVRLADGFPVRLRCVTPSAFGGALVEETGSAAHLEALTRRALERGVDLGRPFADEAALYAAIGLPWIAPELREAGAAEMAAAADDTLPRLVEWDDLHGCLHCHTTYSDGVATVEEMARGALAHGWHYLGIADHSEAAGYAGGLSPDEVARQHDEIDAWNDEHGESMWLFKGIEADILPDGTLDYARREGVLESFDYVVGSVHSSFRMDPDAMTARIVSALADPRLTILGHPTGRLLLSRDAYALDVEAVIRAAAQNGVAIEINADPHRLELDWRWWPLAKSLGVRTAINPDAHSVTGLDNVRHGVAIARKGWLTQADVLTAWPIADIAAYFAARRGGNER
jgi:DNA polymerase (family X)